MTCLSFVILAILKTIFVLCVHVCTCVCVACACVCTCVCYMCLHPCRRMHAEDNLWGRVLVFHCAEAESRVSVPALLPQAGWPESFCSRLQTHCRHVSLYPCSLKCGFQVLNLGLQTCVISPFTRPVGAPGLVLVIYDIWKSVEFVVSRSQISVVLIFSQALFSSLA